MGREMKFALITGGSMVFGAIVFAMVTHARNHAPPRPYVPVTEARELDSLSAVTQAPPNPPAPDYTPTWISPDEPESTTVKEGGTATLSSDQPSDDSRPASPDRVEPRPNRVGASAAYTPAPATDPAPAPPSDTPQQTVNSTPSNNTELREMLRKGK